MTSMFDQSGYYADQMKQANDGQKEIVIDLKLLVEETRKTREDSQFTFNVVTIISVMSIVVNVIINT